MSADDKKLDSLAFEYEVAWSGGSPPSLGSFLSRADSCLRVRLAERLISCDIKYRTLNGERIAAEDYLGLDPLIDPVVEPLFKACLAQVTQDCSPSDFVDEMDSPLEQAPSDLSVSRDAPTASLPTVASPDDFSPEANHAAKIDKSKVIGPYKLLRKLGEGGMGVVWMAEQEKPVRRRVALKVIKAGLDNKQVIARFEAERQALALMNHENIAKILDAGTTELGQPYFVMELVQGISFNKYCDKNKLSIEDRLQLFIPVCNAVQHAHQKGIIHRDLKPSNVLICLLDGKPVPKVIDFGLAKALQHQTRLTDKTMFTELGQVVGTLQYMSPEQAEMSQLDIDTRTDIYSLGVMLYELLVGSTPIEQETLKDVAFLKVLEVIREKEPLRPSSRLSSHTNEAVSGISLQRQIDAAKLKHILRGELDWIVMKALEKDRTRRYETADGFASDIENFLTGEVVAARPPSRSYRFRKYVSRHKGLAVSLAAIALVLIAGAIGTSWFAVIANTSLIESESRLHQLEAVKQKVVIERDIANVERDRANVNESLAQAKSEKLRVTAAAGEFQLANALWEQGSAGRARSLLHQVPHDLRNFEWDYCKRAFWGADLTLFGHSSVVNYASFSPDRSKIVSGSWKEIKVWDATTGAVLQTLDNAHSGNVNSVEFSSDGSQLISCGGQLYGRSDNNIVIWDLNSGKKTKSIKVPGADLVCVSWSPDNKKIASGSYDGTLRIWDANTGELVSDLAGHKQRVHSLAFSPNGCRLVSGSEDNTLKLWDLGNSSEIKTLRGHSFWVSSVAFNPNGTQLASGCYDGTIKVWDAFTGNEIFPLRGHQTRISSIAFSPDGTQLISGCLDSSIKLWDIESRSEIKVLTGHGKEVQCVKFSSDGSQIVSCGSDMVVKLWPCKIESPDDVLDHDDTAVSSCAFSPDSLQLATSASNSEVLIWDLATRTQVQCFQKSEGNITTIAYSADGKTIATGTSKGKIELWNSKTGEKIRTIEAHDKPVTCVRFRPLSKDIASSSVDTTVQVWNSETGQQVHVMEGHGGRATIVAYSPNGEQLASADWLGKIRVWNAATGLLKKTLDGHRGPLPALAYSPDGKRIASGEWRKTIILWDVESGGILYTARQRMGIHSIAFSPDGSRIAVGSDDSTLTLFDANNLTELLRLPRHARAIDEVCFSPDSSTIASASQDGTVILWEAFKDHEVTILPNHRGIVSEVAISNDGRTIHSKSSAAEQVSWSLSGKRIEAGDATLIDLESNFVTTESLIAFGSDKNVLVVDRDFKNTPNEKARRMRISELDVDWHLKKAKLSEQNEDWYAAAFHWEWVNASPAKSKLTALALRDSKASWKAKITDQFMRSVKASNTVLSDLERETFGKKTLPKAKAGSLLSEFSLSPGVKQRIARSPARERLKFTKDKEANDTNGVVVEGYETPDGYFWRHEGNARVWTESAKKGTFHFRFSEVDRNQEYIFLRDSSRSIDIRFPINGGESSMSTNKGKSWFKWHKVKIVRMSEITRDDRGNGN